MNKDLRNKKIIIADDEEIYNMLLTRLLKSWNAEVTSVFNGQELLDSLSQNHYDLVIVDNNMPVMKGSEAIEKIRHSFDEHIKSIPIISLTASGVAEEKEEFLRLGSNVVLLKPIENDTLYNTVSNILELNLVQ
jgi:CheY-like chemotaxis protein